LLEWHNDDKDAIKAKMDQYNTLLKSIFRQIDDQKKHSISKTEWVSFLTKGNVGWEAMSKEKAT